VPTELHENRTQWLIKPCVIRCYVSVMWRPGMRCYVSCGGLVCVVMCLLCGGLLCVVMCMLCGGLVCTDRSDFVASYVTSR
jgi:hypothetical protein